MKILLTGVSGFLGRNVRDILLKRPEIKLLAGVSRQGDYWSYPIKDDDTLQEECFYADLTQSYQVAQLLNDNKYNVIFHLAACASVAKSGPEITSLNVLSTHNLLHHCKPGTKFVFASTVLVDPQSEGLYRPSSAYAASKIACEQLINVYHKQGKIDGIILRYTANVGKYATHGLFKDLIHKMKSDSPYLELFGKSPGSLKPFSYAGDTAKATVFAGLDLTTYCKPPKIYNISPLDCLTVEQVANIVMDEIKIRKEIKWLGDDSGWIGDDKYISPRYNNLVFNGFEPKCHTSEQAIKEAIKEFV